MARIARVAALVAAVSVIWAAVARAVTNGEPDGNSHPYVAVLVDDFEIDIACRSTGRHYRLDTPFARDFLASQGVPLP